MEVPMTATVSGFPTERAALVLIEFQREWLAEDGRLQRALIADKAAFADAVASAERLLHAARAAGLWVAHCGLDLRHDPDYLLFGRGRATSGLRAAIPQAGTWTDAGAAFVPPFVPQHGEFVAQGRSGASVLKNATLDPFLRNSDVRTLYLAGFATHVCVESTLRDAHDLGYDPVLVQDACAAFTREQHDHVRRAVLPHFGREAGVEDLCAAWAGVRAPEAAACSS
jgi:nicotinamidase-related amidase